jgi:hypothetical protein
MSGSCTLSLLFLLAALGCKSTSAHPKELVNILRIYEGRRGGDQQSPADVPHCLGCARRRE